MDTFAVILRKLRAEKDVSQARLAKDLKLTRSAISMYELGQREPDMDTLQLFADYFHVSVASLYGETQDKGVIVPVLGDIAAGLPMSAVQNVIDFEEISPRMAIQGVYFALRLKGESMSPRMNDGDIIIVRQQESVDDGDVAVVLVGDDATVKQIRHERDGVRLIPFNPAFPEMYYTSVAVKELPVTILGKVVELRAKF